MEGGDPYQEMLVGEVHPLGVGVVEVDHHQEGVGEGVDHHQGRVVGEGVGDHHQGRVVGEVVVDLHQVVVVVVGVGVGLHHLAVVVVGADHLKSKEKTTMKNL